MRFKQPNVIHLKLISAKSQSHLASHGACTDAGDLLGWVGLQDASDDLLVVGAAPLQDEVHLLLLELMLQLGPLALDGVVLGCVVNVEDRLDAIFEQELCDLLSVMHPAIVQEEEEIRGLAALEHCQHELDEGIAVYGPGMHVVTLKPAIY